VYDGRWKRVPESVDRLADVSPDIEYHRMFVPVQKQLHVNEWVDTDLFSIKANDVESASPYHSAN
jgi:hypothetical protein